jgi:hypothetical protein
MASFVDILNQGIGGLNTPLGQLGTQMLLNSGYQQGNPSGGARMGQALAGMSEMQRAQALQAHRVQQNQLTEQQLQLQMQQAQAKAQQHQEYQQRLQDPNFLASLSPTARQFAQLGVDPRELLRAQSADAMAQHRQASLAQSQAQFDQRQAHVGAGAGGGQPAAPKTFTPRQLIEEPLPDGRVQKHMYDAGSGEYKPYGAPFNPHSTRGKAAQAAAVDPLEAIVAQATPGADEGAGLGSLPGTGSLQQYAPAPQGADLLMRGNANPAPSIITGGANPNAAREGMRVPGQPKVATPMTKAEYDALPVGAMYQDPVSGKVAAKKAR